MILLKNLTMNESLTEYEKNLIYGNLLENINDVVIMNEDTDPLIGETDKVNKANEMNKAAGHLNAATRNRVQTDRQFAKGQTTMSNKIEAENNERMARMNQVRVNNSIKEDIASIERNIDYKQAQISKNNEYNKRKNERLNKDIERLQAVKQREKSISNNSNGNETVQTQMDESIQSSNDSAEFLFKGETGKLLDYFINKKSLQEYSLQQLTQDLESNPEAQAIIKKIEFYIRKMGSGLDYDSYIDLKVQNGKFKALVKKTKEERLNKIRS